MKTFITALFLSVICMQSAYSLNSADTYRVNETSDTDPKVFAYVSPIEIAAPLSHILVVKNEHDICAIRFTSFSRGNDAKAPSIFSGGEENLYAEYDWLYLGSDSRLYGKRGHEKLNRSRTIQILGLHGFLPGKRDIRCGSLGLTWRYPIAVGFLGTGGTFLPSVAIGITSWTDFTEIDLNSGSIQWYFYEEARKSGYIPLNKIGAKS